MGNARTIHDLSIAALRPIKLFRCFFMHCRTLKNAYEFDMDSPDMHKARFIKEYIKHNEALKDAIEDAKVWITPGKCSLHFKATIEVSQKKNCGCC